MDKNWEYEFYVRFYIVDQFYFVMKSLLVRFYFLIKKNFTSRNTLNVTLNLRRFFFYWVHPFRTPFSSSFSHNSVTLAFLSRHQLKLSNKWFTGFFMVFSLSWFGLSRSLRHVKTRTLCEDGQTARIFFCEYRKFV